eukprot:7379453-Prymnesium_polylepis.1
MVEIAMARQLSANAPYARAGLHAESTVSPHLGHDGFLAGPRWAPSRGHHWPRGGPHLGSAK